MWILVIEQLNLSYLKSKITEWKHQSYKDFREHEEQKSLNAGKTITGNDVYPFHVDNFIYKFQCSFS